MSDKPTRKECKAVDGLFGFAAGVLTARQAVQMTMEQSRLGVFRETEIADLPGVEVMPSDGEWLWLDRLRETKPEEPVDYVRDFLDGSIADPDRTPRAKPAIAKTVSIEEASDLQEAGLLRPENVHEITDDGLIRDEIVRVTLLTEDCPDMRRALEAWLRLTWAPWAQQERPIRRSIKLYNSFYKLHAAIHASESAPPEVIWGLGLATWTANSTGANGNSVARTIDMPLIEQSVEIEIQTGGKIVLTPRDAAPVLNLKPFLEAEAPGSDTLHAKLQSDLGELIAAEAAIDPGHLETIEPILAVAASKLDPRGQAVTLADRDAGASVSKPGPDLRVASAWAIYGRPRSTEARAQDIESLRLAIAKSPDKLPGPLAGYVRLPPDKPTGTDDFGLDDTLLRGDAGAGHASSPGRSRETGGMVPDVGVKGTRGAYFFPLAYNDEQAHIVDALEGRRTGPRAEVVSVTGPPGTGKSHTIANLIAHAMATGKRVLVTARTPEAIGVVREKLPAALRKLVIASTGTDRDSTNQLRDAVSELSDEIVSLDAVSAQEQRRRLEASILERDAEIAQADADLAEIARLNLKLEFDGQDHSLMNLVGLVDDGSSRHGWFTDRPKTGAPADLEPALSRLREDLPGLGGDLAYLGVNLPDAEDVPGAAVLVKAHQHELAHATRAKVDISDAPPMVRDTAADEQRARALLAEIDAFEQAMGAMGAVASDLFARVRTGAISRDILAGILESLSNLNVRSEMRAVRYPVADAGLDDLVAAAERGAGGASPIGGFISSLFNGKLKKAIASVTIDDEPATSPRHWKLVRSTIHLQRSKEAIERALAPLSEVHGITLGADSGWDMAERILAITPTLAAVEEAARQLDRIVAELATLFPAGLDLAPVKSGGDVSTARFAIEANLPDGYAPDPCLEVLEELAGSAATPLHDGLRTLRAAIGKPDTDGKALVTARGWITDEIARVGKLKAALDQVGADLRHTETAGAPDWVARLRQAPGDAARLIPGNWRDAWRWARMASVVDRIVDLGNGDDARLRKADATKMRRRHLEELIVIRTMLGIKQRMRPSILSAMQAFTDAVAKIGKGTGKNAPLHRREAQKAAKMAAEAAPVWIMPEYRIPEQLPAVLGDFDLVILDEASQSDVTAIAAIARAKQALVVGDEEQVSPSNVGIATQRINALRAEHLDGLPNAGLVDENTSIFELTKRMYPETHLVLREHFRCVAPIIQFSTQFYPKRLIPLRVPKASERFDPPLVDVFIGNATRSGKTNRAEADFIVDEIATILSDPRHAERDIGIVSLIGSEQATLIESLLIEDERIGPELMSQRRIVCGDARTMQGQERSIMFLSMVVVPKKVVAQATRDAQQRLNVAMSRARDRVYLVRSVSLDDLKPTDLKTKVLKHFQDPMPEGRIDTSADLLDRCDSGFEREVLGMLLDAGYRARPQVRVGAFRIDIVVEGADDRRLAIELDGDAFHGPDVWAQDMARQAALERAGWVFWRVFGSQWLRQKDLWWSDLLATLNRLGIEPIGAQALNEAFVEARRIDLTADPETVEASEEVEAQALPSPVDTGGSPETRADPPTVAEVFPTSIPDLPLPKEEPRLWDRASKTETLRRHVAPQHRVPIPVAIGSRVSVRTDEGKTLDVMLVNMDPDADKGRIGVGTQLGRALIDAVEGDEIEFEAGGKLRTAVLQSVIPAETAA